MTIGAPPAAERAASGRGGGRIVLAVLGALVALIALGLLAGATALFWVHFGERDADGYVMSGSKPFVTQTYALTSEGFDVGTDAPDWLFAENRLGKVRVRVSSSHGDRPIFVGIAPEAAVQGYLANVAHAEVRDVQYRPFDAEYDTSGGTAVPAAPTSKSFWAASASGTGTQALDWKIEHGSWSLVVMNADASRFVEVHAALGAKVPILPWLAAGLLAGGLLLGAAAAAFIVFALGGRGGQGAGGAAALPAAAAGAAGGVAAERAYPVHVEARIDEPLSRGLWLVKWLLSIPHWIVLAFLWIAFVLLTIAAWFAILFTGRYPRSIFDFNLGILRWTWRVGAYSFSPLSTDRYPPFTLEAVPEYPATLEVPYPERLSRGLVLVKSWLLAIPHLIVVAIFTGGWLGWTGARDGRVALPGLIAVLTVVAAVILLVKERYPRDLFDLILGMNRWAFRVLAYVALMRDEYPPFRLSD